MTKNLNLNLSLDAVLLYVHYTALGTLGNVISRGSHGRGPGPCPSAQTRLAPYVVDRLVLDTTESISASKLCCPKFRNRATDLFI